MWLIIWNRTLKMWWYKLWIHEDEFHKSLDMDLNAMLVMNQKQLEKYWADLARRCDIAHRREFKEEIEEAKRKWKKWGWVD